MNIDSEKISEIITSSVGTVKSPLSPWIEEKTCVGEFDGVQVQIVVTSDESEFVEEPSLNDIAVTPK
ncbi:hypothetical protein J7384_17175 [Endozoicomonas sp. G2_1]|uniref:hypothetical protein n=1 Tax=Endozoicomonas sp. G2_1 TaxID=2821091 RepID=UPI001ADD4FE7|nr:hypothetical protein [Endozoicomonas sp. G2_1]MBO9492097.1 hypothetical protein [Endozoicomonas sp. G2_1]